MHGMAWRGMAGMAWHGTNMQSAVRVGHNGMSAAHEQVQVRGAHVHPSRLRPKALWCVSGHCKQAESSGLPHRSAPQSGSSEP